MARWNYSNQYPIEPNLNLPIFPPNSSLRFRTQAPLSLQQHFIINNIWAYRHEPKSLVPLLRISAQFFYHENEAHSHTPLPPSASSSSIKCSVRPQILDYVVDQEWRIKHLETEITLKSEEARKLRIQIK